MKNLEKSIILALALSTSIGVQTAFAQEDLSDLAYVPKADENGDIIFSSDKLIEYENQSEKIAIFISESAEDEQTSTEYRDINIKYNIDNNCNNAPFLGFVNLGNTYIKGNININSIQTTNPIGANAENIGLYNEGNMVIYGGNVHISVTPDEIKHGKPYFNLIGNKTSAIYNDNNGILVTNISENTIENIISSSEGNLNNVFSDLMKQGINDGVGHTVELVGNIVNENGVVINNLANNNSYWYGVLNTDFRGVPQDISSDNMTITMLANGAKWVPVDYWNPGRDENTGIKYDLDKYASLPVLALDKGIVDISEGNFNNDDGVEDIEEHRNATTNHAVTIQHLASNEGIFKIDLNYVDQNGQTTNNKGKIDISQNGGIDNKEIYWHGDNELSDYIYIGGNLLDKSTVYIDFDPSKANIEKMQIGDKLYFAHVDNLYDILDQQGQPVRLAKIDNKTNVNFDSLVKNYNNGRNIYDYKLAVDSESGSIELPQEPSMSRDVQNENTFDWADWYLTVTGKSENENVIAPKDMMIASYALGNEMDRLNKRMGEARYFDKEKGWWIRSNHTRVGLEDSIEQNSNMLQIGYDDKIHQDAPKEDGENYRGIAVDYTHADTAFDRINGDGENDRYSVLLYDTWFGDKGHYRDITIRSGMIDSDYSIYNSAMDKITSDYDQWFSNIGIEWGYKQDKGNNWYFEPQTQLQIGRINGADYTTNYGVKVDEDSTTSVLGRIGFRLGREYEKEGITDRKNNYYLKADLLHEFAGDMGYTVTGYDGSVHKDFDLDSTWFDVGIGANIILDEDSYFWLDLERVFGGDYSRTWQINGGVRWEF